MNSGEDLDELESIEQRVSSHAIDWGDKQRAYYDGYDGKTQMHRRQDDDDEDDPAGRRRGSYKEICPYMNTSRPCPRRRERARQRRNNTVPSGEEEAAARDVVRTRMA